MAKASPPSHVNFPIGSSHIREYQGYRFSIVTSPAGSLLAVKLHSENGVIFKGKYEILISLILQWQDNPRKTMRNQLS